VQQTIIVQKLEKDMAKKKSQEASLDRTPGKRSKQSARHDVGSLMVIGLSKAPGKSPLREAVIPAEGRARLRVGDAVLVEKASRVKRQENHQRVSRYARVVSVASHTDKYKSLERVLNRSGFWLILENARRRTKLRKDKFEIVIKPDLNAFELTGSTATDPRLVEFLIDLLHERGYGRTAVGEGRDSMDQWLENRDVQVRADLIGYKFVTPKGRGYDLVDLAEDLVPGPFEEGSILYGTPLPRRWQNANFRIVFAKNKTDDTNAYYLCLDNLISILPLRDKEYHYKYRLNRTDVLLELAQQANVNFCIIDAFNSNHGNAGSRVARPIETRTVIAGQHLLLTDYAAARKMGVFPDASPLHVAATRRIGLPEPHRIDGDLTPYSDWINVHPLVLDSTQRREKWVELSQVLQPWMQRVDHEAFPFKDPINEKINRLVGQYLSGIDDNNIVLWSIIGLNYAVGLLNDGVTALQIMYWKDSLRHREVRLNLQTDEYKRGDFAAIASYLEPLEREMESLVPDQNRLRWKYDKDGAVLFEFSRVIPVNYDEFIRRVDVAKTIQYMNDYIGGVIVQIKKDSKRRVVHQIERNLYLPQPNYLALYQGQNIDVSKLELIRYAKTEQKMFWKTIKSENNSARFDDGTVRFVRLRDGDTFVSIFGRQLFTLPLFFEILNLDNFPTLKHILVTHAYTTFFMQTMANLEAVYEGRNIRIGKSWNPQAGEADHKGESSSPSERVAALLNTAQEFLKKNLLEREGLMYRLFTPYNPHPDYLDDYGFAHFKHAPEIQEGRQQQQRGGTDCDGAKTKVSSTTSGLKDVLSDLYLAMRKDLGLQFD
jgi:uncharacterized protein (DUF362 family)